MNYIEDDLKIVSCLCCDTESAEEIEDEYIQEFINEFECPNSCTSHPVVSHYNSDNHYCETCQGSYDAYEHPCFVAKYHTILADLKQL